MKALDAASRRLRTAMHALRKASGTVAQRTPPRSSASIGIFVPYYDAAEIFPTHLAAFERHTRSPFNYYVMKNCTSAEERAQFDGIVRRFGFPVCFEPRPALLPFTHAESLQRMIDATTEEVIVICDVDAFPIADGWDRIVLEALETKDAAGVLCYMPGRSELEIVLHPSFLAFRRSYLEENGLDVYVDGDNDPGYKITQHLLKAGRFTPECVEALLPVQHELELFADRRHPEQFGSRNLSHGFGTVYGGLVFHLWFWSSVRRRVPVKDGGGVVIVSAEQMDTVMSRLRSRYADAMPTAAPPRRLGAQPAVEACRR